MHFVTHTLTVRQGDPEQSCLVFLYHPPSLCVSLLSLYLRNYLVHHIDCVRQMSTQSGHLHMETLKMSSELCVAVKTLRCPLPVSRPTNETSEWEGWREGGHCFTLKLSNCIHPSLSFSHSHTQATLGAVKTETH